MLTAAPPRGDGSTGRLLSLPEGGDATRAAAEELLRDRHSDDALDRLYLLWCRHKTLLAAIANLEGAGGDLDRITVAADLVATVFPLNTLLPPLPASGGRVALSSVRRAAEQHRVLLNDVVGALAERVPGRFVLLSGRGMDVAYPGYGHRLSHDIDIMVPRGRGNLEVLDALWGPLGFTLLRFRVSRARGGWIAWFKLFRVHDSGHQLHVDLLVGGRPSGPGILPTFVLPELRARARPAEIGGRRVLVAGTEDLLLMLAEKVLYRAECTWRDRDDAQVLLRAARSGFDHEYLVATANRARLGGALGVLADEAARLEGQALLDPGARAALSAGRFERRLLAMAAREPWVPRPDQAAPGRGSGSRSRWGATYLLWALWAGFNFRSDARPARAVVAVAADRARTTVLKRELWFARRTMIAQIAHLDPAHRLSPVMGALPMRAVARQPSPAVQRKLGQEGPAPGASTEDRVPVPSSVPRRPTGRPSVVTRTVLEEGYAEEFGFLGEGSSRITISTHRPLGPSAGAVVLCSSICNDFLRNYRREVVLARALARRGVTVQRFHYRGTGNSDGRAVSATVDSMVDDVHLAARSVESTCQSGPPVFVGARFGALIAAVAAPAGAPLVLVDPVTGPTQFFNEAWRACVARQLHLGQPRSRSSTLSATLERQGWVDVLGHTVGAGLFESGRARTLAGELRHSSRPILLLQLGASRGLRPEYRSLLSALDGHGPAVEVQLVGDRESWWLTDENATPTLELVPVISEWVIGVLSGRIVDD